MTGGFLYRRVARARRRWFDRHPEARRHLVRPVISVGNLSFGGSGKTPAVAALARLLIELGERPSLLSRGYGRQEPVDGVVVVSDASGLRADLARSGDEPLMLARTLPGVAVLVSPDRHLAGRLAETHLACTVHLLDDGFQHLRLRRDVDLLMIDPADVRTGSAGGMREYVDAAASADALIVMASASEDADDLARRLGVSHAFHATRRVGDPRMIDAPDRTAPISPGTAVVAVVGIARPERFLSDLERAGARVEATLRFRDHHPFSSADVRRIVSAARSTDADLVITTEKDMIRLLPHRPIPVRVAWLPLTLTIGPEAPFRDWLRERLARARESRPADRVRFTSLSRPGAVV